MRLRRDVEEVAAGAGHGRLRTALHDVITVMIAIRARGRATSEPVPRGLVKRRLGNGDEGSREDLPPPKR